MPPYRSHSSQLLLALSLAAALAAPHASAAPRQTQTQPQPQPTPAPQPTPPQPRPEESDEVLRVTTELVQTDVTVVDKEGRFVDGLKAEQFELKVDGRAQPISFFERIKAGTVDEDAQLAAARGRARGGGRATGPAVPLDRGRAVIFYVDDFHLSSPSLVRTRQLLRRFIDSQLGQNDRAMIATSSGQLGFLQQLTDERTVLQTAISRLTVRQMVKTDFERPQMNVVQAMSIEQGNPSVIEYFVDQTLRDNPSFAVNLPSARVQAEQHVRRRATQIIEQSNAIAGLTLESLRNQIRAASQLPGRKLLYFFSEGFEVELTRGSVLDRLRRVTDAAVRSGVVVYTVDARGLAAQLADLPSAADGSSGDPTGRLAGAGLSIAGETQAPLRTIANETGGRAILNTEIETAVSKVLKETSVYYLLAWHPERDENRGGRFRRIDVSVKGRPELNVLVQRGFYSTTPPDNSPAKRPQRAETDAAKSAEQERRRDLSAALLSPAPRTALPTSLTLNYLKMDDASIVLAASAIIELGADAATASVGPTANRAELVGILYDAQGKAIGNFQRGVTMTPRAGGNAAAASPTVGAPVTAEEKSYSVTFTYQTKIEPGLYQVRVASRDPRKRTGSDAQWIEIPDISKGSLSLSSVFIGDRPGSNTAGSQVVVKADRRFPRGAPLRFLVYVYNATFAAGSAPDVAIQVQLFRDDQPVITTPLKRIDTRGLTDMTRIPYAAELPLSGIPPGRYTLQLTAIDRAAKTSASQRVKFAVD